MKNWTRIFCVLAYLILGSIIYVLLDKCLPENLNNIVNVISVLSAYTSVFALIIMLYQVISVERITAETKDKILNLLMISDCSKLIEITRFIQEDIKNEKYELVLYRMQLLREALLNNKYRSNDRGTHFSNHISILGVHISSLHTCIIKNNGGQINKTTIVKDLEKLIEFLSDNSAKHIND